MHQYTTLNDRALLSNLREGDREAFNQLYDRHWDRVYAQAFKKIRNVDVAKDITQEVFITLWINRSANHIENLEAYLFVAVRNNMFRFLKKERCFIAIDDLLYEAKSFYAEADAKIIEQEMMLAYESVIKAMPPAQKKIFELRYKESLDTSEISVKLNISRKTVQNQLAKAVNLLRTSLLFMVIMLVLAGKR